jgi:hypothetical protein
MLCQPLRQPMRLIKRFKRYQVQQKRQEVQIAMQREKTSDLKRAELIEKIKTIKQIHPTCPKKLENIPIKKEEIDEKEVYVKLVKLPQMSSKVVIKEEKSRIGMLQREANLFCCSGCSSTILIESGPYQLPYLLKGVVIEPDYSVDFIKRSKVTCQKCSYDIGFEWGGTLYLNP